MKPTACLLLLVVAALQASTGVLGVPHKRSLSALARTSQLPHTSSAPADQPGQEQDSHGGHPPQHDKRSELQEEAIREELLRQRAAPAAEALFSALIAADQYGGDNGVEDKRSVSSLARHGNLPVSPDKRSLEALARSGLLNTKNARVDSNSNNNKRSLSALARAGELPGKRWLPPHQRTQAREILLDALEEELAEEKRSLSSLARSGGLSRPSAPGDGQGGFLEQQMKRSLGSLARNWNLPEASAPKRSYGINGVFDLDDELEVEWVKRNAAALLRQSKFPSGSDDSQQEEADRQGQGRRKRSAWDEEVAAPYMQSGAQDQDWEPSAASWAAYWASLGASDEDNVYGNMQKRFLGRIPNMGRHRQKTNEDSPRRRRPH